MIRAGVFLGLAILAALSAMPVLSRPGPGATPTALILGETPGAVPVSLLIQNVGEEGDRLLGASTPIARHAEVHRSRLDDGARVMELARDGLAIPGGSTLVLEPEGHHVMLFGLREDLVQGRTFPITFHFAKAGDVETLARVRRKVDAAGVAPLPPVTAGDITVWLVSAPPAAAATGLGTGGGWHGLRGWS